MASHDLQEPLRVISSYLELIERRYVEALDDPGREFIHYAVDGAQRMSRLIEDLLAYSRITARTDPVEQVDANGVLDQVRRDLAALIQEKNARIEVEQLPTLRADPLQLHQLLQNLIGNAIKFRHPERAPLVRIEARQTDAGWVLAVSDNGIGIENDYLERIFGAFQRLHSKQEYPGTGIGLAICKRIAEQHEGWIRVESTPGKGSRFEIFFPAPSV